MSLNCPKCGSADTKDLGLVYAHYPMYVISGTIFLAIGSLMLINGYKALVVCAAILIAGHFLRKSFVEKSKSFQCNQCQNTFIPNSSQQQQSPAAPPSTP